MARFFEIFVAGLLLLLTSPLLLLIAIAVAAESGLPILFRQIRVGRHGRPFSLLKFRSMRQRNSGLRITATGDPRMTGVGRFLRRYKLDELPQLWNVLRGDMSFLGPRPEVPEYVDLESPAWQSVLSVRPGITDVATLLYRNEEELLARSADPDAFYRHHVLPAKLALNVDYIGMRSPWHSAKVLFLSGLYSFAPRLYEEASVRRLVLREKALR
jgi:lipopolysaccharide/colanic/teichoic acid biosynthesis glycosyltransferase